MQQKIILGKLPVKLILIIYLFPLQLFSQDISGVWTGSMYNDTTRQTIHYELAVDESKGKGSGFSHTTFVIDHVKNIGVKAVKVKMKNNHVYIVDDKFVFNNYSEPPAEGVKMYSFLTLSQNDSAEILSGIWRTNATKYFRPLTGTVFLEKKKKQKPEETIIVTKLIELGLADQLAFLPHGLASRNMVAMNNPSDERQKNTVGSSGSSGSEEQPKQEDKIIQTQNSPIAAGKKDESLMNEAVNPKASSASSPGKVSRPPASANTGRIPAEKVHENPPGSENQKPNEKTGNPIHAEEEVASVISGHNTLEKTSVNPPRSENQKAGKEKLEGKDLKPAATDEQPVSAKIPPTNVEKTNGNPAGKPGDEKATEAGNMAKGKDLKPPATDEQITAFKPASTTVGKKNENPAGKPGDEKATEAGNMVKGKELKPPATDEQFTAFKPASTTVGKKNENPAGNTGNEKTTEVTKPVKGNRIKGATTDEGIAAATPSDRPAEKKTGNTGDSRANTKLEKENKTSGNGEKEVLGNEDNGRRQLQGTKNETASGMPANKSGKAGVIKVENINDKKVAAKEQNSQSSTPPVKNKMTTPPAAAEIALRKIETIRTVAITQDSVVFSLYDNGAVDGDTVSVLLNGKVIMPRVGLLAKAISKTIYLTPEMGDSISVIMYAENLGSIPPNTGLLVIREAKRIYEIRFSGDLNKNSEILLLRKKKN